MKKIYFDYASTSPVDPLVIKAMEPYFSQAFGNPSSPHALGREANKALEESREKVARLIGAVPEEIIFNSGATEGNNHVLEEIIPSLKREANHVIVSSIEHHSVLEPIESLRAKGFNITFCPVDPEGLVNVDHLRKAMSEKTGFIAVMHASNEIGALQPIREIGQLARERKILFLADACQTIGHIPVNVKDFACDFLSFSAHKFYGPKGVGALYVRRGVNIAPYFRGGDQERGRRASTQNVAGAVGLAKALEIGHSQMGQEAAEQVKWRNRLLREVPKLIDGVKVNGHLTNR
ncbi:MAG: cysteine desulfurase family protein, partial [Candidatus Omnitrophota bacterium]|nr:cysteine desulfurase family protein [Candidatus Omnitrophota bacterium]